MVEYIDGLTQVTQYGKTKLLEKIEELPDNIPPQFLISHLEEGVKLNVDLFQLLEDLGKNYKITNFLLYRSQYTPKIVKRIKDLLESRGVEFNEFEGWFYYVPKGDSLENLLEDLENHYEIAKMLLKFRSWLSLGLGSLYAHPTVQELALLLQEKKTISLSEIEKVIDKEHLQPQELADFINDLKQHNELVHLFLKRGISYKFERNTLKGLNDALQKRQISVSEFENWLDMLKPLWTVRWAFFTGVIDGSLDSYLKESGGNLHKFMRLLLISKEADENIKERFLEAYLTSVPKWEENVLDVVALDEFLIQTFKKAQYGAYLPRGQFHDIMTDNLPALIRFHNPALLEKAEAIKQLFLSLGKSRVILSGALGDPSVSDILKDHTNNLDDFVKEVLKKEDVEPGLKGSLIEDYLLYISDWTRILLKTLSSDKKLTEGLESAIFGLSFTHPEQFSKVFLANLKMFMEVFNPGLSAMSEKIKEAFTKQKGNYMELVRLLELIIFSGVQEGGVFYEMLGNLFQDILKILISYFEQDKPVDEIISFLLKEYDNIRDVSGFLDGQQILIPLSWKERFISERDKYFLETFLSLRKHSDSYNPSLPGYLKPLFSEGRDYRATIKLIEDVTGMGEGLKDIKVAPERFNRYLQKILSQIETKTEEELLEGVNNVPSIFNDLLNDFLESSDKDIAEQVSGLFLLLLQRGFFQEGDSLNINIFGRLVAAFQKALPNNPEHSANIVDLVCKLCFLVPQEVKPLSQAAVDAVVDIFNSTSDTARRKTIVEALGETLKQGSRTTLDALEKLFPQLEKDFTAQSQEYQVAILKAMVYAILVGEEGAVDFLGISEQKTNGKVVDFVKRKQDKIIAIIDYLGNEKIVPPLSLFKAFLRKRDGSFLTIFESAREEGILSSFTDLAHQVNSLLNLEKKYETLRDALDYLIETGIILKAASLPYKDSQQIDTILASYKKADIGDKRFLNELRAINQQVKSQAFKKIIKRDLTEEEKEFLDNPS